MIIDESDGTDHQGVGSHHRRPDQTVANEITESLGAVLVAFLRDEPVKAAKQF